MPLPPPRIATLVLVDPIGTVLGQLPPIPVGTPWWQDMGPLLDACQARMGFRPTVLRLLATELPMYPGGGVTYLASVAARDVGAASAVVGRWPGTLDEQPLRASWAQVDGPPADLAWADGVLAAVARPRISDAEQIRTWNLSSVWRLPIEGGSAWLKVVPPFFAHEGAVIDALAGWPVPTLLGRDGSRVLMAELPGDDRYDAQLPELLAMISALVPIQAAWAGRLDDLHALGLPDWRPPFLEAATADVIWRTADDFGADERATLARFADGLPARLAAAEACGLPDTIVHGDFAPGNIRGDGVTTAATILDWGDSTIGHPLLDLPPFLDRTPAADGPAIVGHWMACWEAAVPGSDPRRAAALLAPVATARQAVVYRRFLDAIEPAERVYHAADPADRLRQTVALLEAET